MFCAAACASDDEGDDDITERDAGTSVARDAGEAPEDAGVETDAGTRDAGARDGGQADPRDGGMGDPRDGGGADPRDGGEADPRDGGEVAGLTPFIADEFDDATTLGQWTLLHQQQQVPARHSLLDIDQTRAGHLVIEPTANNGWFEDDKGPLLFQLVTGDFVARTYVRAANRNSPSNPPTAQFNSTGFVARDPASVVGGSENWLMYNVGYQDTFGGSEGKTTVNSASTLFIIAGATEGELILCRRGSTFRMIRRLAGEPALNETNVFNRPDLPQTLQLGLIANGYTANPDLRAEFDWVRIAVPQSDADCYADILPGN